jgi:hypothetical protein
MAIFFHRQGYEVPVNVPAFRAANAVIVDKGWVCEAWKNGRRPKAR